MSKRRQDWIESLKGDKGKRKKINILKDETYKNIEGKMILVSSTSMNTRNNESIQSCDNRNPEITENTCNNIIINNNKTIQDCTTTTKLETNALEIACNEENNNIEYSIIDNNYNIIEVEVENNNNIISLENNKYLPEIIEQTMISTDEKSASIKILSDEIKSHGDESYINEVYSEQSFKITIKPEIHNEPRKENKVQGGNNKNKNIVVRNYNIIDEDEIISIAQDKMITENSPKCNTLDPGAAAQKPKVNRSRRHIHYNKSYLDYMSDEDLDQLLLNEAFPSEASSAEYDLEESLDLSNDEDKDKNNKKKKKQAKKKTKKVVEKTLKEHDISAEKKPTKSFIRQESKKNRKIGESYINDNGELVEGKTMKPNPCIGKNCGNDCGNITEEKRRSLFIYFWQLNSNQRRKDWIAQCAVKKSIKRPSKDNNTRTCSYDYFVNEGEGRRKVCQKYLVNTLDVTQRFILYTLANTDDGYAKTDARLSNGGSNKTSDEITEHARKFIESLPKMPSHYCRKDSKRLYFPEEFKNMCNLHRIYKNNCKQSSIKGMSLQVFRTWFKKSYNIGFHVPKKDKCSICINIKNNEDKSEEEKEKIERHLAEKNESYKRFKYHQGIHVQDKSTICASFDMQKVLNTPHGDSMMLYYSRKFAVYNFTIYESTTRRGYCNVWTETDANRGANEICTCLYNYIRNLDACGSTATLLLYCDSCYGQNKNKFVLSMIRYALSQCKNIKTIQINYLIPGHTYMPVDSVHATIETKIRKCTIWAPSQWPTIMEVARQDPEPYKVEVLKGKDFIGFDDIVNETFKKNQKLLISKLNIATFKNQEPDVIYVKNSMLPDAKATMIPLLPIKNQTSLKEKLYPTELGISAKKYKDLKNLVDKNIVPSRFAAEYKNLKVNSKVKDALVDSDEEDEIENDE